MKTFFSEKKTLATSLLRYNQIECVVDVEELMWMCVVWSYEWWEELYFVLESRLASDFPKLVFSLLRYIATSLQSPKKYPPKKMWPASTLLRYNLQRNAKWRIEITSAHQLHQQRQQFSSISAAAASAATVHQLQHCISSIRHHQIPRDITRHASDTTRYN